MQSIPTLVLAYGNPLRGDDAVGPMAAAIVQSWHTPGVKVLAAHQLVPELIDELAQVERVLFVDAALNREGCAFEPCIIVPKKSRRPLGHHEDPANLLAVLYDLTGRAPEAHLVSISAVSFEYGEAITAGAQLHLHLALAWIRGFLAEPLHTEPA